MTQVIWTYTLPLEELNRRGKNTLSDHLRIEFTEMGPDFLKAKMPITPITHQPMGIMHGGASAALAETVASVAANHCVDPSRSVCVGMELNINHLRPVRSGFVEATARPLHLGRTTQVWEILIRDGRDKLVSASRLTVAVVQKSDAG